MHTKVKNVCLSNDQVKSDIFNNWQDNVNDAIVAGLFLDDETGLFDCQIEVEREKLWLKCLGINEGEFAAA